MIQKYLVITDWFQYYPVSRNFLKGLFLTISRIILINTAYFLVTNMVSGNTIQSVWQWLTCSKIFLPPLIIKSLLLEFSSCPKHLTLLIIKFFLKSSSTMVWLRGVALDWVQSYFHDRKQFVQSNQSCSHHYKITCGVPQGSLLGPLFFFLYINNLCRVFNVLKFLLFVDDTNIFLSGKDPDCWLTRQTSRYPKFLPGFKQTSSLWINKSPIVCYLSCGNGIALCQNHCKLMVKLCRFRVQQMPFLGIILTNYTYLGKHTFVMLLLK